MTFSHTSMASVSTCSNIKHSTSIPRGRKTTEPSAHMAKTRPDNRASRRAKNRKKDVNGKPSKVEPPEVLLAQANLLLQTGEPDNALQLAYRALTQLQSTGQPGLVSLPALTLLGEINIELGDPVASYKYFEQAADVDPEGTVPEEQGGGAEKFFWLAQLCEEGGLESVRWYQRGADCLRRQITSVEDKKSQSEAEQLLKGEKREKLAQALCGIAEVYMTDLSWDDTEAEAQCESAITEALLVAPDSPEVLQTVASVRISQNKRTEARRYLEQSMAQWQGLPPEHEDIPDFPTRISLARLLMEAEMEDEGIAVLEGLVQQDDHSVEAWYLGGWCLHLLAEKQAREAGAATESTTDEQGREDLLKKSRAWLTECLRLYKLLDYEDDRLMDHALELIGELNSVLGPPADVKDGVEIDEGEDWEDADDDDDDEEMEDS